MDFNTFSNEPENGEKFTLIPENYNNTGVLFFDLKTRGLKFTFRNKEGFKILFQESKQQSDYLNNIFIESIGSYTLNSTDPNSNLTSIRFLQPKHGSSPFEFSQLIKQCWRIDTYPEIECKNTNCIYHSLIIKFCVKNFENHQIVRKYQYLLESKELEATNKE